MQLFVVLFEFASIQLQYCVGLRNDPNKFIYYFELESRFYYCYRFNFD